MNEMNIKDTQAEQNPPKVDAHQGKGWTIKEGKASTSGQGKSFQPDGAEGLVYNNPFSQTIERAWYDGKIVYAVVGEEMHITDTDRIKVALEYQPVYSVELDGNGWRERYKPVPGQLNIYGSIPGQKEYSAIWKFYYVIVPEDYQANSLRSIEDCKRSGYEIRESNFYRN